MKFSRRDDWHARSDCGRYTITTDRPTIDVGCYIAWRAHTATAPAAMLAAHRYELRSESARQAARDAAIAACEQDAGDAR